MDDSFLKKLKDSNPGDTFDVFCFVPDGAFRATLKVTHNMPYRHPSAGDVYEFSIPYRMLNGKSVCRTEEDRYERRISFETIRYDRECYKAVVVYDEEKVLETRAAQSKFWLVRTVVKTITLLDGSFCPSVECMFLECSADGAAEVFQKVDELNKKKTESIKEIDKATSDSTKPLFDLRKDLVSRIDILNAELSQFNKKIGEEHYKGRLEENNTKTRFVKEMVGALEQRKRQKTI